MNREEKATKIINVLVYDRPNVLVKLISFFEKRGFKIENINLIETEKKEISKYNIIISGKKDDFEVPVNQLFKIIETIDVNLL